ncbi:MULTISPECIES: hypothetical protein [unclassified Oceanobacter]|jgi:hypothetical protein|uniref:hypothetical protein n=1 Tax=unclassified Oceanobacter TaxID=2620260 RepID=UPI0026E40EED|nr:MULTISPECIES: hypothetical protein [unclassified Oceanobacter]MDO6681550.1 hypothetical protein [Oceanobacter sp. 5_MG-2023]MDP2507148.1 hypothetical protein [Oceanobacter sp. 3_MG-2023]MDP2549250.1 hypothetical protein [Oceanobacter sp. 4_MG-2023]MDP2610241.1 hypothetical protein [Oceanobacter sp. 1_MG-2023]MDP2613519.1 hypothetical protein [Oceanobacter sp. 2_MG-2023]
MTAPAVTRALEANRRFTDLKDAQARLSQAQRDFDAKVISEEQYLTVTDVCQKIIRACRD